MDTNHRLVYEDTNFRGNSFINPVVTRLSQHQNKVPISFGNIQHSQSYVGNPDSFISPNFHKSLNPNVVSGQIIENSIKNSGSRIVYRTQPAVSFSQPIYINNPPQTFIKQNKKSNFAGFNASFNPGTSNLGPQSPRSFSSLKRSLSPLRQSPKFQASYSTLQSQGQNEDLQRYETLRWQNKYEDLKTKYFDLLSIVDKNSKIEDSWILQEQNKLLKQKINALEQRDQMYYNEVANRVQKMIDFHQQTTGKQCQLLLDRFRLENKVLQKL